MNKRLIRLGLFVIWSTNSPLTASAAPVTTLDIYTEARSVVVVGGDRIGVTGDQKAQVEVGGATAAAETKLLLTDPAAGTLAFFMAAELFFEGDAGYFEAAATGVARYAFSLSGPATLELNRTTWSEYLLLGEEPDGARLSPVTVTLNGNGVFLESDLGAPANIVTLSLLPGVYTLQADADVRLVNLGGPAAARLLGSGVLDFEITPAAVPEPAAWPLIVTALGALGARRDPVMRLVAWRCRGRVT